MLAITNRGGVGWGKFRHLPPALTPRHPALDRVYNALFEQQCCIAARPALLGKPTWTSQTGVTEPQCTGCAELVPTHQFSS